jgi:two-component system nitrate/nitrite response regulator NarL
MGIVKCIVPTVVIETRTLLREGVTALLNGSPYRIIFSGSSVSGLPGPGALTEHPQLAILGLSGGSQETTNAVHALRERSPDCKIVALGERGDLYDLNEILSSGINGILFNVASAEALLKVFDLVLLGQQVIILDHRQIIDPNHHHNAELSHEASPSFAPTEGDRIAGIVRGTEGALTSSGRKPSITDLEVQLSNRERQVLACVARGEANKIIARSCSITEATVKAHLKAILRKISVRNRTQAALWAIDKGLASELRVPNGVRGSDPGSEKDDRKLASTGTATLAAGS